MSEEILNTIIIGAPNFVGFAVALFMMWIVLRQKQELIKILIDKWSECEEDSERARIARKAEDLQEK